MGNLIKNKKIRERTGITIAFILIALGIVMVSFTFASLRDNIKANLDSQIKETCASVDYNLNESMNRFDKQMEYFVNSRRFQRALETDGISERNGQLESVLSESSFGNMGTFEVMTVEDEDGDLVATSSEDRTYEIGDRITDNIYRCTGSAGNEFLAFRYDLDGGITCYGMQNINRTYEQMIQRINAGGEHVVLLEAATGIIFFMANDSSDSTTYEEATGEKSLDIGQVDILLDSEKKSKLTVEEYRSYTDKGKERLTMSAVSVPSTQTDNGIFAVAVSANFNSMSSLIRVTATKTLLYFLLVIAGAALLILILLRSRREKHQVDRELELLKEKNRQMEELNKTTEEIAHRQRLETIGTLTSSIAHEFNNLLTPIMGYSMMTLEALPENQESVYDDVLEIYNASVRAKEMISRLSDLSRKNTEKAFAPIRPDALAERVLNVASPALPTYVDIERDFNCRGRMIMGNETQLSQLLLNLIINAFHAIGDGEGKVVISTACRGGQIVFTVKDDGPGISKSIQDRIFDPFFTTKESGEGTGLGLAIALQAAEDHGGRIELESEPGEGCSFSVYIPELIQAEEAE